MGRSATSSPPRVISQQQEASEFDTLLPDRQYSTFCSISLASEPRTSLSAVEDAARLQERLELAAQSCPGKSRRSGGRRVSSLGPLPSSPSSSRWRYAHFFTWVGRSTTSYIRLCSSKLVASLRRVPFFAVFCLALLLVGLTGVGCAILRTTSTDGYLFLGALVSFVFSLIVVVCYLQSRPLRAHPNPLLFSKSLVDLLLAALYIFEYCATEFPSTPVVLPFRLAAVTQALLVCSEFWFFAMPIDMVQSITNPFTSYARNFQAYWFYAVLSGLVCGTALSLIDDDPLPDCRHGSVISPSSAALTTPLLSINDECDDSSRSVAHRHVQRFFWFYENTDAHSFWWHHWVSYHLWVLVYLVFATLSIIYVKRRLQRGLEQTFDVRRRVLSSGLLTCWIYISWSLALLGLFVINNIPATRSAEHRRLFHALINLSAFLHSARGGLDLIVWFVVNRSDLGALCSRRRTPRLTPAESFMSSSSSTSQSGSASASASASASTLPMLPSVASSRRALLSFFSSNSAAADSITSSSAHASLTNDMEALVKPELNTALRKQMIQMATTGIVESVEHYHRLHRRINSNQTFSLDWQRSPQRELSQLSSSLSLSRRPAAQNSTIQVIEANDAATTTSTRFSFLPLAMKEMQFYDFQPKLFASIRHMYGINDAEYIYAFRHTMNERISEGSSGAFVFTTCDRNYLVKSTTAAEKNVLLSLLPSYHRYLKWNPQTLLPRFFGFHAMKMYGQTFYFVVMGNILNTTEVIHHRYDIKGSWVDRNAPACVLGDQHRCSKCNRFFIFGAKGAAAVRCDPVGSEHSPDVTLRDNDLKKRLKLEDDRAAQLVKQLVRDSNFLAGLGIMDYSLLIGTHYSHFTTGDATAAAAARSDSVSTGRHRRSDAETALPQSSAEESSSRSVEDASALLQPGESGSDNEYLHVICDNVGRGITKGRPQQQAERGQCAEESVVNTETSRTPLPRHSRTSRGASTNSNPRFRHQYRAHQVSGPSTYYFGLVDILQKWTLAKQMERAYKVHLLRKSARGVSAMAPRAYAARFQRKMKQLFVTSSLPLPPPRTSIDLRHDSARPSLI